MSPRTPSSQVDIPSSAQTLKWHEGEDDESTDVTLANICASMPAIDLMLANTLHPNSTARENYEDSSKQDVKRLTATEF